MKLRLSLALSFSLLVGCNESNEGATTKWGETISGIATYYDADGGGACMFAPSPGDLMVAALNEVQWSTSDWCGACADVSGPDGSVRVRIVDQCPGCDHGHLDLSPQAFDQIAERALGRVDITWQLIPCEVSGPVSYLYKEGSNPWWTALQVRNHRLPIASLQWSKDGGSWNTAIRQEYNYFLAESGMGEGRVYVRITAIDGQVIEDELPAVESELEVAGSGQFE